MGAVMERLSGLWFGSGLFTEVRTGVGRVEGKREKDRALLEDSEDLASSSRRVCARSPTRFCQILAVDPGSLTGFFHLTHRLIGPVGLFGIALLLGWGQKR